MAFIDGTVVNVALPALQSDLGATVVDVQWVVEAYALFLASLLLVGGSLGDRFGRRRIFSAGVLLFAGASAYCGLSPDVRHLILARAIQGIGGALLVPGSLAIISASFTEQERGRAIGTWSAFTAITAAVGPVIGGWLIEYGSWRWVFIINVPLGLIVFALTLLRVPESKDPNVGARLDWGGSVLATIGLGGLSYGLIESSNRGWGDLFVVFALVLGVLGLALLPVVERRVTSPIFPLTLFRSGNFRGANLLTLFLYGALSGALFFLPLNLIQIQGYTATEAGASILPFILLISLLSRWSGGLVDRYGARRPLIIGPCITATGFGLFCLPSIGGTYWTTFFPAVLLLGLGMAITVAPLTTTVMNAVSQDNAGVASGVNNALSRVAAVLSVALLSLVMVWSFNRTFSDGLDEVNITTQQRRQLKAERIKLAAAVIPREIGDTERAVIRATIDQSFLGGFRLVMTFACVLALASGACAWTMISDARSASVRKNGPSLREGT